MNVKILSKISTIAIKKTKEEKRLKNIITIIIKITKTTTSIYIQELLNLNMDYEIPLDKGKLSKDLDNKTDKCNYVSGEYFLKI